VVLSTVKLTEKVAAKTQRISVPAGTFSVYEVDVTLADTVGKSTTTTIEKDFYAAGVGLVKSVVGTGSNQTINQLTSYGLG
jgi:hypothetical protein